MKQCAKQHNIEIYYTHTKYGNYLLHLGTKYHECKKTFNILYQKYCTYCIHIANIHCQPWSHAVKTTEHIITESTFLWPPTGQAIIFCSCGFYLLLVSSFFPRLISAVADWMSTILPHMMWPWCEFRMQVWNALHSARIKYRMQKLCKLEM